MLVLSRKAGESLVIAQDIVVKIIAIEGNRIRIGIDADRSVSIVRGELIKSANHDEQAEQLNFAELQLA